MLSANICKSNVRVVTTVVPTSAPPQALYKLYNVAANHRHLYHHAFPGHQVEEAAGERDKKRD